MVPSQKSIIIRTKEEEEEETQFETMHERKKRFAQKHWAYLTVAPLSDFTGSIMCFEN